MSNSGSNPGAGREEMVSLADRLGMLQVVRMAMVAVVLASTAAEPQLVGLTLRQVAPVTALYSFVTVAAEIVRRVARVRGLGVVGATLLIDGAYLALVLAPVGGPRSVLVFLVYVHLIAVTLLTSYRTGLKIALWHSLLMIGGYWAALSRLGPWVFHLDRIVVAPAREVTLSAIAFWLVALCTGVFASLSERELRRGKAELGALAAMGSELEQARHPTEVGQVLLGHVLGAFGFRQGLVYATTGQRTAVAGTGADEEPASWVVRDASGPAAALDAAGDELVQRCWAQRGAVRVRAVDPATSPVLAASLPGAVNVMVVPLVADGRPLGVLAIERGGGRGATVTRSTVDAVISFAAHAALALRSAWLLAEVERLARVDALTGLANRRAFEATLVREAARAARTGEPLSVVVLDIDHFKAVNDTHPDRHQGGDAVLRHVGASLASVARVTDLAARYGGDEFCVLLPACPPIEALAVAERLRAAIAAYAGPPAISASAGVATLPVNAEDGVSLVAAADEALYVAKEAGRNRATRSRRRGPVSLAVESLSA